MKVNPVQLLPLEKLYVNPANPKKPMGLRYRKGLKASLSQFGFAGLFVVASNPDGTYEVLDGNTRLEELAEAGVREVPCVVLDLDADARKEFVLAHDRNKKVFDEDVVTSQLKALADRGRDVKALATLTATDNLQQLLQEASKVRPTTQTTMATIAPQGSLVLYGPAEDIQAVKELAKRVRGRMSPVIRLRQSLEQAEHFDALSDEGFLLALISTLSRMQGDS